MTQPRLMSGLQAVRVFQGKGWRVVRQRGSHIIMVKEGSMSTLSVPAHKEVARGTLRGLIRAADLLVEEFNDLADRVL